jgi:hypothetical protein
LNGYADSQPVQTTWFLRRLRLRLRFNRIRAPGTALPKLNPQVNPITAPTVTSTG